MKIVNTTKNTVLAEDVILAESPIARMKGLLGRKELKRGQALILRPCNSIHTLFMHFSIDILFVSKYDRIVKAISNFRPFRLSAIYFKAAFAIELPCGVIQSTSTQVDDEISLQ